MQRAAAAVAGGLGRYDACIQKDGVDNFDHCSGFVAVRAKLDIRTVFHIMGRENAGTTFAAEQDNALVKHRQTVNDTRTADDTTDLALNAVEEADIDRVKAAVKRYPRFLQHSSPIFHPYSTTILDISQQKAALPGGFPLTLISSNHSTLSASTIHCCCSCCCPTRSFYPSCRCCFRYCHSTPHPS